MSPPFTNKEIISLVVTTRLIDRRTCHGDGVAVLDVVVEQLLVAVGVAAEPRDVNVAMLDDVLHEVHHPEDLLGRHLSGDSEWVLVTVNVDVHGDRQVVLHALDLVHLVAIVLEVQRREHLVEGGVRHVRQDAVLVVQQLGHDLLEVRVVDATRVDGVEAVHDALDEQRLGEVVGALLRSRTQRSQLHGKHAQPRLPDLVEEPFDLEELVESRPPSDAVEALGRNPSLRRCSNLLDHLEVRDDRELVVLPELHDLAAKVEVRH